ncbi:SMI1/KNR4 family protein [Jeotgalibacillus sp. ET6]|uniref:SMI1/KNR4 family protein n=1 Tax=Jeotgalibacillus sp. ET6 TaxID=3037260 RepID=UPI0024183724|nr:SMI1/KNR4 family protein [Jeotgalibacillus sp. ET6]MDG5471420.1 SMI1/KNR4 family protein [Jeotgalibacillus sp. ET6]
MTEIEQLLTQIKALPHCRILESKGLPALNGDNHLLPDDLKEFYSLCGGLVLFEKDDYPIHVVSPDKFELANPVIVGDIHEEDISFNWYIICDDGTGEYLTIDLDQERLGKCYDSFYDRHGLVGESRIIALSFTGLLDALIHNKGQYWYWLKDDFNSPGDAYDEI